MAWRRNSIKLAILIIICVVVIAASIIYCKFFANTTVKDDDDDDFKSLSPSPFPMGIFKQGAIASNGGPCASIGRKILKKYKNAVDATIAVMICEGVVCMQNTGIGGGFLMTIYKRDERKGYYLNARESAPSGAYETMFHADSNSSQIGGLSIAIPGELKGYEAAYKRFGGKAPWAELFEDTIKLCDEGVPLNQHFSETLRIYEKELRDSPSVSSILLKENGELPTKNDKIKLPKLAQTLRQIATHGVEIFYNGTLTSQIISEIKDAGGIITEDDLANYEVTWTDPLKADLSQNLMIITAPPPGSGALFAFMMKVLDGFIPSNDDLADVQRITETFKFAYGKRTLLGDPAFVDVEKLLNELNSDEFILKTRTMIKDNWTSQDIQYYGAHYTIPDDHGTANIVVMAPNGDTVVSTATINTIFGSKVVSKSTGIIFNNEMDDFSAPSITNYFGIPPSEANFIKPGKRPMSSMCPTIIINNTNGDVVLALGAAGGTRITTATTLVAAKNLWYNMNIKEAVDDARFHHQLWPLEWAYEPGIPKKIVDGMSEIGHTLLKLGRAWKSAVTAISTINGSISTVCDFRRPGSIDGF